MEAGKPRIHIDKQTPAVFHALGAVATAVRSAAAAVGLDQHLVELINIRVSQIDGCAYCLDVHSRAALADGETEQRLAVLAAWRRSELYTHREQAALALAEITATLPDEDTIAREYEFARQYLSDDELSVVAWAATSISAFNRVSILSRHPVRPHKEH